MPRKTSATRKPCGFVYSLGVFRRVLTIAIAVACAYPARARAERFGLQLALEPGISNLKEADVTNWSFVGGGINPSFGVTDRVHITGLFDRKEFTTRDPTLAAQIFAIGLRYDVDVFWLTPFLELGLANVYLRAANGGEYRSSGDLTGLNIMPWWDLYFGIGADVRFSRWMFGGIVFRYFAVGGTDVLSDPAYSTINARLGFMIGAPAECQAESQPPPSPRVLMPGQETVGPL